jgi:hypothetical protein
MKIKSQQWIEVVKLISTFVIGLITALYVQACTVSMSISKYNSNSNQSTKQTPTSTMDSTKINIGY